MAETLEQLAGQLKVQPDLLITLLDQAGIGGKQIGDVVSPREKIELLKLIHQGRFKQPRKSTKQSYVQSPQGSSPKFGGGKPTGSQVGVLVKVKRRQTVAPLTKDSSIIKSLRKPPVAEPPPTTEDVKTSVEVNDKALTEDLPAATEDKVAVDAAAEVSVDIETKEPVDIETKEQPQPAADEIEAEAAKKPDEKQEREAERPKAVETIDEQVPESTEAEDKETAPKVESSAPIKDKPKREDKAKRKVDAASKPPTPKKKGGKRADTKRKKLHVPDGKQPFGRARGRRAKQPKKVRHQFIAPQQPKTLKVEVSDSNSISELAKSMSVKTNLLIKMLFEYGQIVTINERIDKDTASVLIEELGHIPTEVKPKNIERKLTGDGAEAREQRPRSPVVVVMGHVDHGKTTLLDTIRSAQVVKSEQGGITQHIGAYMVETEHGKITFLDTPGHEAFAEMRARGSKLTDIIVLVVAADDGVKPQTIESINHAKQAEVPIIVAVNKIDSVHANPNQVIQQLTGHGIIAEDIGGETQVAEISALRNRGIDTLLECIQLQAEILELEAPVTGPASGIVIEARVDKGRGVVATVLVQNGTLKKNNYIVAGTKRGRVRVLTNDRGKRVKSGGPSVPLEIQGFREVPIVGDKFDVVPTEKAARELVSFRELQKKEPAKPMRHDISFLLSDEPETVNVVIKSDVQGSAEAISNAVKNLSTDKFKVNVVHKMVGGISQNDVNLAITTGAIIIGFNVRADAIARRLIDEYKLTVIYSGIIYDALDALKDTISGMIEPDIVEEVIGRVEIREVFQLLKGGRIAGCFVSEGVVQQKALVRVIRTEVVIHNGEIASLRRFKQNVNEVKFGLECGIMIRNYHDIKEGDVLEVYLKREVL